MLPDLPIALTAVALIFLAISVALASAFDCAAAATLFAPSYNHINSPSQSTAPPAHAECTEARLYRLLPIRCAGRDRCFRLRCRGNTCRIRTPCRALPGWGFQAYLRALHRQRNTSPASHPASSLTVWCVPCHPAPCRTGLCRDSRACPMALPSALPPLWDWCTTDDTGVIHLLPL